MKVSIVSQKILDGLWKAEKQKILNNLPKNKLSLRDLQINPVINLVNEEKSIVLKKDLGFLQNYVPSPLAGQLMLPFIFQKQKELCYLLGDNFEKWTIERILGMTDKSPYLLETFTPRNSYYFYHFRRIQKEIPSLTFLTYKLDK